MFNIDKFLSKFSKKIDGIQLNLEKITDIIERNTGIKLSVNNFEIKNNVIYINSSPAVKNKIFIFKESIITDLEKEINLKILDIR